MRWKATHFARVPIDIEFAVARLVLTYDCKLTALDIKDDHCRGVNALAYIVKKQIAALARSRASNR